MVAVIADHVTAHSAEEKDCHKELGRKELPCDVEISGMAKFFGSYSGYGDLALVLYP